MQGVIEQIYDGELCPSERPQRRTKAFHAMRETAISAHDTFEEKLCQPMKEELDEYLSKESDVNAYHTKQAFVDGFRLGAQLMLEILEAGKDD